jgi:hypothetical protein
MKIVVFDLDETMGYFTEYGIFWDCLKNYLIIKQKKDLTQNDFNNILDLFPEFLRPNIINILTYLKKKKQSNCCHKMMIYTNNNGPKEWANNIISYFETKIKSKLIDQIIAAFKINGKRVELCRTSHNKSHTDLIRCTKIPIHSEICFLDDSYHPEMTHDNIYYINIKPYYYDLNFDYMINTFKESIEGKKILGNDSSDFEEIMLDYFKRYKYDVIEKDIKEYEIDKIVGKQIITHLQDFFNKSKKNKTIKNISYKKNKTQKKY